MHRLLRKPSRGDARRSQYHVLILEDDADYAVALKHDIESRLPAEVIVINTLEKARTELKNNPDKYFIGITSVLNLDSNAFETVDLLSEFSMPVIAVVNEYADELRDQLIKRNVIDYVVKGNKLDNTYVSSLIARIHKNRDIKVLVVDDSKVSRFVMTRELKLQKFQIIEVDDGTHALEALKANPDIKLVLVDQQMQSLDGTSFVIKARELYPKDQLLIIGLSTSNDARLAVKFLKAGANDFISKPFNYEMLLCRINQNLEMLDAVDLAKNLSYTDYLSGLYNRRYFFEFGGRLVQTSNKRDKMTVMIMDIDYFKKINDKFGHHIGDEVIKNFSKLLKKYFADKIVARIGGEEFVVLSQTPISPEHLDEVEKFRLAVAQQAIKFGQEQLQYTCSIGVATLSGNNLDKILLMADKQLYKAKKAGRNRIAINN